MLSTAVVQMAVANAVNAHAKRISNENYKTNIIRND